MSSPYYKVNAVQKELNKIVFDESKQQNMRSKVGKFHLNVRNKVCMRGHSQSSQELAAQSATQYVLLSTQDSVHPKRRVQVEQRDVPEAILLAARSAEETDDRPMVATRNATIPQKSASLKADAVDRRRMQQAAKS